MKQNTLNLTYEETIGKEFEEQYKKVSDCETPILNIPIYRAKKINSDEYVEGYYTERVHHYPSGRNYIHFHNGLVATYERIDPTTLSIHFKDMLDSQGNKIFASLSEDGKGGDICYVRDFSYGDLQGVARYEDNYFRVHRKGKAMGISLKCRDIKVIGIQE